jgi:hypothetical protein
MYSDCKSNVTVLIYRFNTERLRLECLNSVPIVAGCATIDSELTKLKWFSLSHSVIRLMFPKLFAGNQNAKKEFLSKQTNFKKALQQTMKKRKTVVNYVQTKCLMMNVTNVCKNNLIFGLILTVMRS